MERGNQKLIFAYDSTGRREGFSFYEGNSLVGHYYYLYNAQGDVTGILNQNMYLVDSYTYDSWGKLIACEGDAAEVLGNLNPFRYRGYIYDEETQLYYLNSRYYDPETGRFINADGYVSTGQGILGYNMFAYCLNNPVNYNDNKGTTAEILQGWESIVIILPLIDGPLPIGDIIAVGGIIIFGVIVCSETEQELPNQGSVSEVPDIPDVSYPGDDPTLAPEGTEWRGNGGE